MKFCLKCEIEYDDSYNFCPKCATKLVDYKLTDKDVDLSIVNDDLFILGKELLDCDEFEKAFAIFKYMALHDDAEAQFYYGYMFDTGKGVEQNYTEAMNWYIKSARQDFELAKLRLGNFFEFGYGVDKNLDYAFKLYSSVIGTHQYFQEQHSDVLGINVSDECIFDESFIVHPILIDKHTSLSDIENDFVDLFCKENYAYSIEVPTLCLGKMYKDGICVEKNLVTALNYLKEFASYSCNIEAIFCLGEIYSDDKFEDKNLDKARKFYRQAALLGHTFAKEKMVYLYENDNEVLKENPTALYLLGLQYDSGIVIDKNIDKALYYLKKAALLNNVDAQYYLGYKYESGKDVNLDLKEAKTWYEKAVDNNSDKAMVKLGLMYRWGQGVQRDYNEAVRLFKKASENDNIDALIILWNMYSKGNEIEKDISVARFMYEKLIKANYKHFACALLGIDLKELYHLLLSNVDDLLKYRVDYLLSSLDDGERELLELEFGLKNGIHSSSEKLKSYFGKDDKEIKNIREQIFSHLKDIQKSKFSCDWTAYFPDEEEQEEICQESEKYYSKKNSHNISFFDDILTLETRRLLGYDNTDVELFKSALKGDVAGFKLG